MFLLTFFNTDKVVKQTFQKVSNIQEKSRRQILSLVKGIVSGVQKIKRGQRFGLVSEIREGLTFLSYEV